MRVTVIKFLEKRSDATSGKSGFTPRGNAASDDGDAAATALDNPEEGGGCVDLAEACRRSLDHFVLLNVPPEALVSEG